MQKNPIYVYVFKCVRLMHLLKLFTSMSSCLHIDCVLVFTFTKCMCTLYFISISLVMVLSCSWNVYYHKIPQSERTFLYFFFKRRFIPAVDNLDSLRTTTISGLFQASSPQCQPKSHLVYIKTHKTGSCTTTNLIYR